LLDRVDEYLHGTGPGALGAAPSAAKAIVEALDRLEEKLSFHDIEPDQTEVPRALYAGRELQKYVDGEKGDIQNMTAARVYLRALRSYLDELKELDEDLGN
jgi:predicted RNase H-like nuclease (RuvC/YqgF family)